MNKKSLTETDIRTKFITPALVGANGEKWNLMAQIREEFYFTKGRVIVRGKTVKRGEAKKADYVLFKAGNCNLDLKNPHNPDTGPGDVDHLLPEYEKLLARIAETRGKLKAQLMEALSR